MKVSRALLSVPLLVLMTGAAFAADVVYPVGSRLGLAPPPGLVTNRGLQGFADPGRDAGILIAILPKSSYAELDKTVTPDSLKREGVTTRKREKLSSPAGDGFYYVGRQRMQNKPVQKWLAVVAGNDFTALVTVQVPDDAVKVYPEKTVRDALATLTARAEVPEAERLELLPFKFDDLANFKVAGVAPGRAVLLSDVTEEAELPAAPHIAVSLGAESPSQAEERDAFARRAFDSITNIKDITIVSAEPLRIGGQPGYQIFADAKDAKTNSDLKVVQWIRFGNGVHVQLVGTSKPDAWVTSLARFRTIRDGIQSR